MPLSVIVRRPLLLPATLLLLAGVGCASSSSSAVSDAPAPASMVMLQAAPPSPDPRVGLKAGMFDAGEATWNLKVVSRTKSPEKFFGSTNSDLAFSGKYAIQGNYNGWQMWDISNPASPTIAKAYYCPASQSDVSVYKNLLIVSGEGTSARIDCGAQGVKEAVSGDRLRGVRIFDISDINNPRNVGNVQTCRGSHTHSLLVDPKDAENIYVYISGSAGVRPAAELVGCVKETPDKDQNSALFRIEIIKIPLAHPEQAAIVASPRIFNNLVAPPSHGETAQDIAESKTAAAAAKAKGEFTAVIFGLERVLPARFSGMLLDSLVKDRSGTGAATAVDSAKLHAVLPTIVARMFGEGDATKGPKPGPTQCHDITLFPAIGLAGGACEGYGMLLDISNPTNPVRIGAVSDSNFSYWHSATFNNDGSKVLFTDEWGGGGAPKCRSSDPKEWGADAIFTLENGKMVFQSYYKLPAAQTPQENCVAHNGSLIPIPGRDIMVQAWYQGGISVFDFSNPKNAVEIAYFDRGPVNPARMDMGGSWSVYWYNGLLVSSEIARGLDILELTPNALLTQNEINAALTVHYDYLNAQGQPKMVWPATFALARAYADQLERGNGLGAARLAAVRASIAGAEAVIGGARATALNALAAELDKDAGGARDGWRVNKLAGALRALAKGSQ